MLSPVDVQQPMNEDKKIKFTAKIADVESFVFMVSLEEEEIYRKAVTHVNQIYQKMQAQNQSKPSQYVLAKVALAFAELYCRKQEQLTAQSKLLSDFEKTLDDILLSVEE